MKAVLLTEPRKIIVTEVPPPEPGPADVLIKVALAGICGSDHTLYQGRFGVPMPVIPGHEAIGRIEAIGSGVSGLTVGQRVTLQPNIACGDCPLCRAGQKNLCPSKIRLGVDKNGVFAEFASVPADYVWPIPDQLEDDVAVFTEPLAVLVHAMKVHEPKAGDRVLIFGAGIMGLLALQLIRFRGIEVTTCDISKTRLSMAEQLGSTRTIDGKLPLEPFHNSFDVIYETSGVPMALSRVIKLAAPRARVVALGLPGKEHPVSTDLIVRKELQVMGSLIYTDEFPESIRILETGRIRTDLLHTGTLSLNEIDEGLRDFSSPERMKMLVKI